MLAAGAEAAAAVVVPAAAGRVLLVLGARGLGFLVVAEAEAAAAQAAAEKGKAKGPILLPLVLGVLTVAAAGERLISASALPSSSASVAGS